MSRKTRLEKLETTLPTAGTVMLYGKRYPVEIAALLQKAPAYQTHAEAAELHRYRYEHDAGYREMSDRPVPTMALEVMLGELVRRDFETSEGYEDVPGEVARDLLARPDTSPKAREQARRYLDGET